MKKEILLGLTAAALVSCSQTEQMASEIRPDQVDGHARIITRYQPVATPAPKPAPKPILRQQQRPTPPPATMPPAPLPPVPEEIAAPAEPVVKSLPTPKPQILAPAQPAGTTVSPIAQKQPVVAEPAPAPKPAPAPVVTQKQPVVATPAPAPKPAPAPVVTQKQPVVATPAPAPKPAPAPSVAQQQPRVATQPATLTPKPEVKTPTPKTTTVEQRQPSVSSPGASNIRTFGGRAFPVMPGQRRGLHTTRPSN